MSKSDIVFNAEAFHTIDPVTEAVNNYIIKNTNGEPKWHEIGAAAFRKLQDEGKTNWPAPAKLESAKDIYLPSRDSGRDIKVFLLHSPVGDNLQVKS